MGGYDGKVRFLSVASGEVKRQISIAPLLDDRTDNRKITLNKNFEIIELVTTESLPEKLKVQKLNILPKKISLVSPLDYVQILIMAYSC